MADENHGVLCHRLRGNSHERKQIRSGEDSAFRRRIGTMLNQGIDGNDKEAGKKSERCEQHRYRVIGKPVAEEQRRNDGHADHSQRNQSVFDFISGKIAGGHAAERDAHRNRGDQQTGSACRSRAECPWRRARR